MKYLLGASLLVMTLIVGIFFFPSNFFTGNEIPYDDEQDGLSQQIVIKFSHVVAENTPKGLAAQRFADLVEEKTDGLVIVEVIPNGSLYTDDDELEALIDNDVQMLAPSLSKLTKLSPEWALFDLPFLFENDQDIKDTLSSELGKKFLTLNENKGIKGLALWSNGFKQMSSNLNPLRNPEDFSGQRFRIMPSPIIAEQFKALGAKPIEVPFDQLYTSLQEEAFDGQENTISNIYSRRIYGMQKYMTVSNHGFLGYAVLMNKEFWDSLPEQVQRDINEAMAETTSWMVSESLRVNREQLGLIEQQSSIDIDYLSEQEQKKWFKALKPVYHKFLDMVKDDEMKAFVKQRMEQMETR
ncbi:DctP family TRAP transporter solute-binding subunit [Neobacillus niacini]|uniref:DctP family TRAP transporter solute-binding subunit n=1 Tax=Neobacillus niacini TaxID=86668 RepID=UPI0021CB6658|nr:DctP family TRAP transporter solute-binding subunit [Neobacillus niacini]MCM3764960.1 DctP family TRAP transporter solute-binding subunit [Neobacillus niacini]